MAAVHQNSKYKPTGQTQTSWKRYHHINNTSTTCLFCCLLSNENILHLNMDLGLTVLLHKFAEYTKREA